MRLGPFDCCLACLVFGMMLAACAADVGDAPKATGADATSGLPNQSDGDAEVPDGVTGSGGDDSTSATAPDMNSPEPPTDGNDAQVAEDANPAPDIDATFGADASSAEASVPSADGSGPSKDASAPADASTRPVDGSVRPADGSAPPADASASGCTAGATVVVLQPSGTCGGTGNIVNGNGSLGAVCVEFHGSVPNGWNASNATGCSITLTGGGKTQTVTGAVAGAANQPPMPAGPDGYVYWNLTPGCVDYAAIQCY
ncbi:MAG: hypothetical protein ABSC94_05510 [Polyangiaceae bacterium]